MHHPELVQMLQVGSEVAAARAAADNLSRALTRRLVEFPASQLDDVRRGPIWDRLLRDYLLVRAEIRRVCSALVSVMADILDVDRSLISSGLESTSLINVQRVFYQGAQTRLEERTKRLLEQAGVVFDAGQRVTASVVPSLSVPTTD